MSDEHGHGLAFRLVHDLANVSGVLAVDLEGKRLVAVDDDPVEVASSECPRLLETRSVRAAKQESREVAGAARRVDVAVVPLAIPLLAGPGSMATVVVLMAGGGAARSSAVTVAVVATFAASYAVLRSASLIERALGESALAAIQRVLGLVLAAMSTQLILTGARALVLDA